MKVKIFDWLKCKKCPSCGSGRLMAGPFYDRLRIYCLNCNYRFRLKKGPSAA